MQTEQMHEQIYGHFVIGRDVYDPMISWAAAPHRHLFGVERDSMFFRFANHEVAKLFVRAWR